MYFYSIIEMLNINTRIMLNKKYFLLAAFLVFISRSVFGQESQPDTPPAAGTSTTTPTPGLQWSNRDMTYRGKNYDVLDSAYYPKFRSKQFHKYIDHQEIFPPKPRNQWEIGFGLGLYNLIGNVPTLCCGKKAGEA